jgi:hypothetical protein
MEKRPILQIIGGCFASEIDLYEIGDDELLENLLVSLDVENRRAAERKDK